MRSGKKSSPSVYASDHPSHLSRRSILCHHCVITLTFLSNSPLAWNVCSSLKCPLPRNFFPVLFTSHSHLCPLPENLYFPTPFPELIPFFSVWFDGNDFLLYINKKFQVILSQQHCLMFMYTSLVMDIKARTLSLLGRLSTTGLSACLALLLQCFQGFITD